MYRDRSLLLRRASSMIKDPLRRAWSIRCLEPFGSRPACHLTSPSLPPTALNMSFRGSSRGGDRGGRGGGFRGGDRGESSTSEQSWHFALQVQRTRGSRRGWERVAERSHVALQIFLSCSATRRLGERAAGAASTRMRSEARMDANLCPLTLALSCHRRTRWIRRIPRWTWWRTWRLWWIQRRPSRRGSRCVLFSAFLLLDVEADELYLLAEIGTFVRAVEGEMLCSSSMPAKVSSALGEGRLPRTSSSPTLTSGPLLQRSHLPPNKSRHRQGRRDPRSHQSVFHFRRISHSSR
jgi:hypothetical protein